MEDYPSLAEGNGLENRQVGQTTREFESLILLLIIAGWSSLVARRAHNPKVVGSNPAPAIMVLWSSWLGRLPVTQEITSSSLVRTVFERDLSKCHSFIKRMVFLYCRKVPSEIWKNQVGCLNWQN